MQRETTGVYRGGLTPLAPMMLAEFEARLAETPGEVAVIDDQSSLTYSELDLEARAYSLLLVQNGVGSEAVVAVVAQRGLQYIPMLLAVLRAGAAFMPIEPGTPVSRARLMCSTARIRAVLVQPEYESYASEAVAGLDHNPPIIKAIAAAVAGAVAEAFPKQEHHGLAYVIFTSGSTGIPKGAMITNSGMNNHLAAKTIDLALQSRDVVGFTASLAFDISVWQALNALCIGGRVCVASGLNLSEPKEFVAWIERHGVTIVEVVPSFLTVVLDLVSFEELRSKLRSLRFLIATGEALPGRLAQRWYECCPNIQLLNAYGPTECSDDVTHHIVTAEECRTRERPAIGREIVNTDVYVVDPDWQETGVGVEGELFVGGRGVGRGYIADPVRTALAFVPDHLSGRPGERLYRTGDRGKRMSDGAIEYLGRWDRQVKVRGHRVELGDVESELLKVSGVTSAACILSGDRMRAFVTLQLSSRDLKRATTILDALRKSAPAYLVPQELTILDRIPTGTSGKTDYRALEALPARFAEEEPTTNGDWSEQMSVVRTMFAEILGVPTVRNDDDFFMAGGDSLRAMKLLSLARERFHLPEARLRGFLLDPTPRGMIAVLKAAEESAAKGTPRQADNIKPGALSSGQERLWLIEQLHQGGGAQLLRLKLTLRGPLDERALQHALDAVVVRHEPLRTIFSQDVGVPVGTVWPRAQIALERVATDQLACDLFHNSGLTAGIQRPPLALARLAKIAEDHYILTLVLHHLVADGWSLAVLGEDISSYYQRWLDGHLEILLPPIAYSDYVSEERQWLTSDDAVECEQYWSAQLAGAPPAISLPFDRSPSDRPDFTTDYVVRELSADETTVLATLSRTMKATPFMLVMAACYISLREVTANNDVVIGIDALNRSWPGSDQLIGTFVNQLPVRLSCPDPDPSFSQVLLHVREQCLGAYEHERLPFHKIVAAVNPPRRAGRFPLFQVKITQQGAWRSSLQLPGVQVTAAEISEPMIHWDLMLDVSGELDRLRLELVYRPEIIDRKTAASWADTITSALRTGLSDPEARARNLLSTNEPTPDTHDPFSSNEALVEPRTQTEVLVATVWAEVLQLQLNRISITDNFFEVGGHSLAAAQVISELSLRTGVNLQLETFFDLASLEDVAAEIDRGSLIQSPDNSQVYEGEL